MVVWGGMLYEKIASAYLVATNHFSPVPWNRGALSRSAAAWNREYSIRTVGAGCSSLSLEPWRHDN